MKFFGTSRTPFIRLILTVLAVLQYSSSIYAQTFNFITREASEKKSAWEIKKHNGMFDTLIVRQDKWDEMADNVSSWTNNLQFKSVHGFVKFYVDHKYKVKIHDPYTFRLTYKVYGYGNMADTSAYTTFTDTLTISYKPDSLATFQDMQFKKYSNFHKMMVVMTGLYEINGANNPPTPVNLDSNGSFNRLNFMVEATIQVQPFYKRVKVGSSYVDVYGPSAPAMKTGRVLSGDNLQVQWNVAGANITDNLELMPVNYELEWTYIDNYKVGTSGVIDSIPVSGLSYTFKNNSTRVSLDTNVYKIPLIYQQGHIVFRVRMVRPDMTAYRYPIYGPWSLPESGTLSSVAAEGRFPIANAHLKDSINWQYTVSFAEQGKYKQVMSYYDGMLKNRQSITRFNSLPGKVIATEQVYDFEGRPSISILPTPITTQAFRYQYNLSLNSATTKPYRAQDFDYLSLSVCPGDTMPSPLAINALAYMYYSPQNPEQQGFQKFVPDAGGYPFVQTIYSPGYDERVDKQGGAGDSLQIGTGHTVKNSYVSAEQMDLNRLFGLDIGRAGFYRKTVSRDPNGQLSLNVTDYKGKTVTSAMIGIPDTIGHALVANTNLPDTTAYSEDFIQGLPQQIMGNKRILDKLFFNDAAGNATAQYKVTMSPFKTFCPGKYLSVAMSYDYRIADECGDVISNQGGMLGQTGVSSSASPLVYTSALNSFYMEQGKHSLHKELTVNTEEIGKAVDQFMALPPAENCLRSEQSFIKEAVLSKTYPCPENYENLDCNTCDGKKYEMMQELWPNKDSVYVKRKYGIYRNVNYVQGNNNSIFTLMNGVQSSSYRYQDSCLTLPASITKSGRTYTNLRTLPVDTFIYIFNDTIAEALLPLHPEYCELLKCTDDVYEKKLRKIPDAKVAEALGLLKLSDIIAADPLFVKMQTLPANYPNPFDTLSHTQGGTLSLDTLALLQAYCNCGDSIMLKECYQNMFQSQISSGTLISSYVKERYFAIITNLYIGNRRRYLFNLNVNTGQPGACTDCSKQRMQLVPQPIFINSFNPNGSLATGAGSFLGVLQNSNPSAAGQLQQYTSYLFNADSLNAAQDSAINIYNSGNTVLCNSIVDDILEDLVNCASSSALNGVKSSLLALCSSGQVQNGAYTPSQIRTALTSNGIALGDLCNPYLVNYDNNMTPATSLGNGKFLCNSDKFYADATQSLNGYPLEALKNIGNMYAITFNPANDFELSLKTALGNPASCGVSVVHTPGQPLYTLVFSSGAAAVKLFIRTGTQGACADPLAPDPSYVLSLSVDCINNVPFSGFANGYVGKYMFAITAKRASGSQVTQCVLPAWTDKVEMNHEGENKLAGAIPPTQMRDMVNSMLDTFNKFQVRCVDHPYYKTMLRNYMNFYLKKVFSTEQYLTFIDNCALGGYRKLYNCNAYVNIVLNSNGDANTFMTAINNVDTTVPVVPILRQRSGTPERVLIDFNTLPINKLRIYRDFVKNYNVGLYSTPSINLGYPTTVDSIAGIWYIPNSANFIPTSSIFPGFIYPTPFSFVQIGNVSVALGSDINFGSYKSYYVMVEPGTTEIYKALNTIFIKKRIENNLLPGVFLNTREPTNVTALDDRDHYLGYVYPMLGMPANKVLDSLQSYKLEASSLFAGLKASYGHPAQPGSIQNLYLTNPGNATTNTRYAKLTEILTAVKTYFGQTTGTQGLFFTGSNTRQIQPNNKLTAFRCRDSAFWFRHFDSGDTLYNVFIRIPAYLDTSYLPGYVLDEFTYNPGEGNSYSFKVKLRHNNPNVPFYKLELDGYTDFVVARNNVVKDVLLAHPLNEPYPLADTVNNCERQLLNGAILEGKINYKMYIDSIRARLYADFSNHILSDSTKESLVVSYRNQRFNYTLYYYDRAGNLMRTVPPAGTVTLGNNLLNAVNNARDSATYYSNLRPYHRKASNYAYNTLNQVVSQVTPDGGTTEYFYDAAGRAIFSQNEKQRPLGSMTYTLYDKQGRIVETGQTKIACVPYFPPTTENIYPCSHFDNTTGQYWPFPAIVYNLKGIPHTDVVNYVRSLSRSEVVLTNYDTAAVNITTTQGMGSQDNLRKRVASIRYFDNLVPMDTTFLNYNYGMHFSYDIAGNVKTLVRDYPAWKQMGHQFKRIDYDYDVISGKVNLLSYNRSFADQFYQRYSYDADNRITQVETSQDGYIWKRDASYEYYYHGPLARMSVGDLRVQGVDYAYTIQGWLKAINGDMLDTAKDIGGDGRYVPDNIHARDAVALSLNYFKGDYKPIGNVPVTHTALTGKNMYNGNIPRATTAIAPFPDLSTSYTYDQLNRLVKADYAGINRTNAQLTNTADYYSSYAYDPDGNLQKLVRNGNKPATRIMDSLVYRYNTSQYNNKLQNVNDYAANNYQNDIAQHTNAALSRYLYDPAGNVIKDLVSGQDTIKWNHYNKVTETRNDAAGNSMAFAYDGAGNRYLKTLAASTGDTTIENSDYYVRDAQGNILAIYKNESRFVMTKQQWIEYITLQFVQQCGIDKYIGNLITPYYSQNGSFKNKIMEEVSGNESWVNTQLAAKPVSFYLNKNEAVLYNTLFSATNYQELYKELAIYDNNHDQHTLGDGLVNMMSKNPSWRYPLLAMMLGRNNLPRMDVMGVLCGGGNDLMLGVMNNFGIAQESDCNSNIDKINEFLQKTESGPADFMTAVNEIGQSSYVNSYKAFLFHLFKPTTILGSSSGAKNAFELLCQSAPSLLSRTMELQGVDAGEGCTVKADALFQQVAGDINHLFDFMVKLRETGQEDRYKTEYRNFMTQLAVDNTIVNFGVEDSTQNWVLDQICMYMPRAVEAFMESVGLDYTPGNFQANREAIRPWLGTSYERSLEISQFIADQVNNNGYTDDYDNFLQEIAMAPQVLDYDYYSGNLGLLANVFQSVLAQYADRPKLTAFFDAWPKGRDLLLATNSKPNLLSVNYDGDPTSFLNNYITYIGNHDILNKALYSISDLNLHYFISKIKESTLTSQWCTVTVIDSIIHNTYVNALKYQRLSLSSHHIYGSSRLGTRDYPSGQYYRLWDNTGAQPVNDTVTLNSRRPWFSSEYNDNISGLALAPYSMTDLSTYYVQHQIGKKQYELTNHLGNVQATLTDYRTIRYEQDDTARRYSPVIAAAYDYYPFGMLMPDRYISDTTSQCITVTQSKWITKWVLDCYDVYKWVWPGFVKLGSGTAVKQFEETNPDNNGILVTVPNLASSVSFEFDVVPNALNEIQLEIAEMVGKCVLEFTEEEGGRLIRLGSLSLSQPFQNLKLTLQPKTTKLRATFVGKNTFYSVKVKTICTWKPVMVQESILVDVCDNEKDKYRFGFNGQEKVNEWAGIGNFMDYKERGQDTRVARFLSIDPIAAQYPWNSTYAFAENRPIDGIDLEGREYWRPYTLSGVEARNQAKVAVSFAGDVAKGAGKSVLSGIGFITEFLGQIHYGDRMSPENRARHFTQTNGKNVAQLVTEVVTAPIFAIRDVYNDPTNGEKWGAMAVALYSAESSIRGIKTRGSVISSKSYAYAKAEAIIAERTKNKMPRAVTAVVDIRTGKVYYGESGGLTGKTPNAQLIKLAPEVSKTAAKDPLGCAECDAMNNALNDGAKAEDLLYHTVEITKKTSEVTDKQRCDNCVETTRTAAGVTSDN